MSDLNLAKPYLDNPEEGIYTACTVRSIIQPDFFFSFGLRIPTGIRPIIETSGVLRNATHA